MHTVKLNNDTYYLPSQWNELSKAQLLKVAEMSLQPIPLAEFLTKTMFAFLGFKVMRRKSVFIDGFEHFYIKHGKKNVYLVTSHDVSFISENLQFLFVKVNNDENISLKINSKLTKNLLPEIKHAGTVFHGPSDGLTNLCMNEYIHAETNFYKFCKTSEEKYLDKLIAIIYRPRNKKSNPDAIDYTGDLRLPFNDFLTERYTALLKSLNPATKYAIFIFYQGCKNFLINKFPNVYSGGSSSDDDVFMGFMSLVNALANSDVTKKEEVRKAYLMDVMITLEQLAKQRIEAEKK